jgi:hypothetical protein
MRGNGSGTSRVFRQAGDFSTPGAAPRGGQPRRTGSGECGSNGRLTARAAASSPPGTHLDHEYDSAANEVHEKETTMSQPNVEKVIGRLVTDEEFRRRFVNDPWVTIRELVAGGCDLNECERLALSGLDLRAVDRMANSIDPSIQKVDTHGGAS